MTDDTDLKVTLTLNEIATLVKFVQEEERERTWVGFTDGEKKYLTALGYIGIDDIEERLKRMNAMRDTAPPKRKTLAELLASTPVDETSKHEHEPVCFIRETSWSYEIAAWDDPNGFPVYTAPPKKEWVGLTDEERHNIREWQEIQKELGPVWAPMMLYLCLAIEQALKEKNT